MNQSGTISLKAPGGFCKITPDDGSPDLWCNEKQTNGTIDHLVIGNKVSFTIVFGSNNQRSAENVTLLN